MQEEWERYVRKQKGVLGCWYRVENACRMIILSIQETAGRETIPSGSRCCLCVHAFILHSTKYPVPSTKSEQLSHCIASDCKTYSMIG